MVTKEKDTTADQETPPVSTDDLPADPDEDEQDDESGSEPVEKPE